MSAQAGYFDTLKSIAGKVFTYLSTITLTGTDGKTITVTQDTSLDEAVAMSSKAPKSNPTFTGQINMPAGVVFDQFEKIGQAATFDLFSLTWDSPTSGGAIVEIVYGSYFVGLGYSGGVEIYDIVVTANGDATVTNLHTHGAGKLPAPTVSGKNVTFTFTADIDRQVSAEFGVRIMGVGESNGNLRTINYTKL